MYIDTASDLQKKFLHTYTLYKGELVYWLQFNDHPPTPEHPKGCVQAQWTNVESNKNSKGPLVDMFDPKLLKLIHIDAGWYNMDMSGNACAAWSVLKRGARQNYKGISYSNYILRPGLRTFSWYNMRHGETGRGEGFTFANISSLMQPRYFQLHEALDNLMTMKAVALSREFAVMLSPLREYNAILLSKYGIVGGIKGRVFHIRHEGSFQEVLDLIGRNGLDYRVIFEPWVNKEEDAKLAT
jgi:hypothetical protein